MRKVQFKHRKDLPRNSQAGFFRAYALFLLAIVSVAYGAYFLGKLVPTSPVKLKSQYEALYLENDAAMSDAARYNGVGNSGLPDLYDDYATRYESPRPVYQAPADNRIGSPVNTSAPVQNQSSQNSQTQVVLDTPSQPTPTPTPTPAASQNPSIQEPSQIQVATGGVETFQSTINKKVSFQIPAGTKVQESGTTNALTFTITTADQKVHTMNYAKVADGCFDPIGSFAIDPSAPVDYRIIDEQKEIGLKSTYRALQLFEQYGTYAGGFGVRGNACIQAAIPTRIELRSANYTRIETQAAFQFFGDIIYSLKV